MIRYVYILLRLDFSYYDKDKYGVYSVYSLCVSKDNDGFSEPLGEHPLAFGA